MRVLTTARTVPSPQVSEVHVSSQMGSSFDYERLYGACRDRVLAISHFYAAFDGFHSADGRTIGDENGNQTPSAPLSDGRTSGDEVASRDQLVRSSARARADLEWWASIGTLLWSETAVVHAAAAAVRKQLRRATRRYSCVHLSDLDAAVLTKSAWTKLEPLIDLAQPAAQSRPFSADALENGEMAIEFRQLDPGGVSSDPSRGRLPSSVCDGYAAEAKL